SRSGFFAEPCFPFRGTTTATVLSFRAVAAPGSVGPRLAAVERIKKYCRAANGQGIRSRGFVTVTAQETPMQELLRSTDPVLISWLIAALRGDGIEALVFDTHTSVLEGSIGILPRRVMVVDEDIDRARAILDAGPVTEGD
ncbi:MAG: DUF2007 domain-containing protein, partial [Bauldia litoralis]